MARNIKELTLRTSMADLICHLKDKGEMVESFKVIKPKFFGGGNFIFYLDNDVLTIIPNELIPNLCGSLHHQIKGDISEDSNGLKVVLSICPPIWLSVVLWSILSTGLIIVNTEWYTIACVFLMIYMYISNLSKCLKLYDRLVQILTTLTLPNITVQRTARDCSLQRK